MNQENQTQPMDDSVEDPNDPLQHYILIVVEIQFKSQRPWMTNLILTMPADVPFQGRRSFMREVMVAAASAAKDNTSLKGRSIQDVVIHNILSLGDMRPSEFNDVGENDAESVDQDVSKPA